MPKRRYAETDKTRIEAGKRQSRRIDREIARLARRQHGMVATRQLLALGLSENEILHRVAAGRLIRVHRGVYAVGHLPSSPESRWMAAQLAYGDDAYLRFESALMLWGLRDRGPGHVFIGCPRQCRPRPGIDTSRATLPTTRRNGIRVTTPIQTLLDAASRPLTDTELGFTVHEAQVKNLVTHEQLVGAVEANRGRRGNARLRRILDDGPARTRSQLEELALRFLKRHGLPHPETNVRVHGEEVDVYFREQRLILEIQSERYHGTAVRRRSDAEKQTRLEARGERVLHVHDFQLQSDDPLTAKRIERALQQPPQAPAAFPSGRHSP